ncbi:hemicentin-1-like [Uloborus diversus]|uniref:hemicentin-1-like n=1 Tax=Uloborus diversus TaxID=327109 RepID=UPI002409DA79|nr:hemicentin-1-like [Uloborus diversus]
MFICQVDFKKGRFSTSMCSGHLYGYILLLCFIQGIVYSLSDINYEGRKYVSEDSMFEISCLRSKYGVPKWTRNGVIISSVDSEYILTEESVPVRMISMKLKVEHAKWNHRGEYKCDPLRNQSHWIEIVPSKETDEKMKVQNRVQLRPGRKLKLVCDKEENTIFPITWYKDGKRMLQLEEDSKVIMEGRTLNVLKVNESDAGDYICAIEVSGLSYPFADHLGSHILVTYAARVKPFPMQIRPILNRDFFLECEVDGFPVPRIAWFVDDIPIGQYHLNDSRYDVKDNAEGLPGSIFYIKSVKHGDDHEVICAVENLEGSAHTRAWLAVRNNQVSTNENYPGKGIVLIPGLDLVLQCNNTDYPSDTIQWLKESLPVNTTDKRIKIDASTNTLLIEKAVETDTGNYTCTFTPSAASAIIVVRTAVKLGTFDNSRNVVQGQNIVLICNATQGVPLPTLQWLKDEEPLNVSNPRITLQADPRGIEGTTLTISDAQFEDRAEYTCVATNEVNTVNATILVRVKDKYAALWPFLGICAEVAVLCTIIFIYEKRRQKPDFDESETEHNTENKNVPDQEEKSRDVRQRK